MHRIKDVLDFKNNNFQIKKEIQKEPVRWLGKADGCQICEKSFTDFFIDGSMKSGIWTLMCPECHNLYGIGLGLGKGQKYDFNTKIKIEG